MRASDKCFETKALPMFPTDFQIHLIPLLLVCKPSKYNQGYKVGQFLFFGWIQYKQVYFIVLKALTGVESNRRRLFLASLASLSRGRANEGLVSQSLLNSLVHTYLYLPKDDKITF